MFNDMKLSCVKINSTTLQETYPTSGLPVFGTGLLNTQDVFILQVGFLF